MRRSLFRSRQAPDDLRPDQRIALGRLIWGFIKAGWSPPPPDDVALDRMLEDMQIGPRPTSNLKLAKLEPSATEKRILLLMAHGHTRGEIALILGASEETIKTRVKNMYKRMGAANAAHAVMIGLREGYIE